MGTGGINIGGRSNSKEVWTSPKNHNVSSKNNYNTLQSVHTCKFKWNFPTWAGSVSLKCHRLSSKTPQHHAREALLICWPGLSKRLLKTHRLLPSVVLRWEVKLLLLKTLCTSDIGPRGPQFRSDLRIFSLRTNFDGTRSSYVSFWKRAAARYLKGWRHAFMKIG